MPEYQPGLFEMGGSEEQSARQTAGRHRPLAARMRPQTLAEVVGQQHILGPGCLLPQLVRTQQFGCLFFYGPPGTGKTSLAEVIAASSKDRFMRINAVLSNVAELRGILSAARAFADKGTLLFIDEIHRFNRAQQDLLLPDMESGIIRLIGATTHNPGFYINQPLLSRGHLFKLEPLPQAAVVSALANALNDPERGLGAHAIRAEDGVLQEIALMSQGDLRRALNALEVMVLAQPVGGVLNHDVVKTFALERHIRYDGNADEHYDTASAFIKSMRGCDPDAALYWLAKMLQGGEDPRFIARRLVIFASEDIGLADSRALPLAVATFQACEQIGLPECELNLAHATLFMATAPKSNSATLAIGSAKEALRSQPVQAVPLHLKDSHTAFNKSLGQGKTYLYSHDYPENISGQSYLEQPVRLYTPKTNGAEAAIAERLKHWQALRIKK